MSTDPSTMPEKDVEQAKMACEVSEEDEVDVMETAVSTIRHMNFSVLRANQLRYIIDKKGNVAILVGYGHKDPEQRSRLCHIIKFRVSERGVPCYGVVSAMQDYAVNHTRVAKVNVKIWDEKIPTDSPRETREFLVAHYLHNVVSVIKAFRERHKKVNSFRAKINGRGTGTGSGNGGKISRPDLLHDDSDSEGCTRGLNSRRKRKEVCKGKAEKKKNKKKDSAEDGVDHDEAEAGVVREPGKEGVEMLLNPTFGVEQTSDDLFLTPSPPHRRPHQFYDGVWTPE